MPARADSNKAAKMPRKRKSNNKSKPESMDADSMESIPKMEYNAELDSYVLGSLRKIFNTQQIHNTKFIVGPNKQTYKVNDTALAVISPVFREMLFGKPRTAKDQFLLESITAAGFSALIRHSFALDPDITHKNVMEVIQAAQLYKVYSVQKLAMKYFSDVLQLLVTSKEFTPICGFISQASRLGLTDRIKQCFEALQTSDGGIQKFVMSDDWNTFTVSEITSLLECDYLAVEEDVIWRAVVNWAKHQANVNGTEKVAELKKVYRSVRFPLGDTRWFSKCVVPEGCITQKETLDLFCYLTYPEGGADTQGFCNRPRVLWDSQVARQTQLCGHLTHPEDKVADSLGMEVNSDCQLLAIGALCGDGVTEATGKVWKNNDGVRDLLSDTGLLQIANDEKDTPVRIDLPKPVTLKKGQRYELEVDQSGPTGLKVKDGQTETEITQNGRTIKLTWHKSSVETETTVKKGNFPCVWIRALSGGVYGDGE